MLTNHFMLDEAILLNPNLGIEAALFFDAVRKTMVYKKTGVVSITTDRMKQTTGLKRRKQETARAKLRKAGLIKEKIMGYPALLYYYVDQECLQNYSALQQAYEQTRN